MTTEQLVAAERLRSLVEALKPKCCNIHAPQFVAVPYTDLCELLAERDELRAENARATADRDAVYRERAHLVALLAALFPSGWAIDPMEPNPMDWRIVYVQTPAGQLSWHIAQRDWELFAHVPENPAVEWDGHSTAQKYERVRKLIEFIGSEPPF